ncbi:hypothetical protein TTHERM_00129600 (macronuclear) [Tetrahymena thermophila SB210]|uniref:C3H1-type domain-containing protein n=1 Tax=Tetrahymena thermophila (strain SB210) TaxID=312017 RepID=I7MJC5_TETTS|nr:hypothetical protein TTHERM_00129600 [Tetrahymena thermophila SB210]EAR96183.1 hypothetical protein TTHERM_00129600 [Tetrahymena thermophila SB210]|eukprot:XP_001016428.1 hypothetical protein TTHERM_00129600 [Tetrahymena thermophila SB210]
MSKKQFQFIPIDQQQEISKLIKTNGQFATYPIIKITAEYLKQSITLYRDCVDLEKPSEVFKHEGKKFYNSTSQQIRLLFTGKIDGGHFDAVIVNQQHRKLPKKQFQQNKSYYIPADVKNRKIQHSSIIKESYRISCRYHKKGICKYKESCRYSHRDYPQLFNYQNIDKKNNFDGQQQSEFLIIQKVVFDSNNIQLANEFFNRILFQDITQEFEIFIRQDQEFKNQKQEEFVTLFKQFHGQKDEKQKAVIETQEKVKTNISTINAVNDKIDNSQSQQQMKNQKIANDEGLFQEQKNQKETEIQNGNLDNITSNTKSTPKQKLQRKLSFKTQESQGSSQLKNQMANFEKDQEHVIFKCGCQPTTHKGYSNFESYRSHFYLKHEKDIYPGSSHDKWGNSIKQQAYNQLLKQDQEEEVSGIKSIRQRNGKIMSDRKRKQSLSLSRFSFHNKQEKPTDQSFLKPGVNAEQIN